MPGRHRRLLAIKENEMSDNNATLTVGGDAKEYGILSGSVGPKVIDVRKLYANTGMFTYDPGFTSTASCDSGLTYIDGDAGILLHRGYPIDQLAEQSSFMEVSYLLLNGELPSKADLEDFTRTITRHTMVHEQLTTFYRGFRRDAHPMAIMCGVVGALSAFYHDSTDINDPEQRKIASHRLIAKMPTIAAMAYKYSVGQPFVYPRNDLSYTANFLRMTFSVPAEEYEPDPVIVDAMDKIFILHADHEQNASTDRHAEDGEGRPGKAGRQRSSVRRRQGTGADRAQRPLLHRKEALPECGLLFGRDPVGHRFPDRDVHGAVRARPHRRLGCAVERNDLRPSAEDRPSAPAVHRSRPARLCAGQPALIDAKLVKMETAPQRRRFCLRLMRLPEEPA